MSRNTVDVVRVDAIEKHPNADSLGIVKVGGFTACVALKDWKPGDLAAYIAPDSLVPVARPEFAFLADGKGDMARIRVKRLRGVYSQGLLVPAPAGANVGDDVAEVLGVQHYEPPVVIGSGEAGPPPEGLFVPVYDVENFNRFPGVFVPGEAVVATEKIHGANARFVFWDGRLHAGSRTLWKIEARTDPWWRALDSCPGLAAFLERSPGTVAYGEVYGRVQSLRYGLHDGLAVRLFDLFDAKAGAYMDADAFAETCAVHGIPTVPHLYAGPFDEAALRAMAEGPSTIPGADNIREGIVVRTAVERFDPMVGRVQLKMVSNAYLERN